MSRSFNAFFGSRVLAILILVLIAGCANTSKKGPPPEPILEARTEIPEEQLLDVGIGVFDPGTVMPQSLEKHGTTREIRKAESHYMAYHLKDTLQRSAHWGAVRVMPGRIGHPDLFVSGRIEQSDGERLRLKLSASDVSGQAWLDREYQVEVDGTAYLKRGIAEEDPFQAVYNEFTNDLIELKLALTPEQIVSIRNTSKMRFAEDIVPEAYASYVEQDGERIRVIRLPAEGDPMIDRLMRVRDREYMYIDTLDKYYEDFYWKMRPQYDEWRKFNQTELEALHEVERKSATRIASGVALIAAAIALEMAGVPNTATLRNVMVIGGGAVIIDGINVSQESDIHRAGIEELGESFNADIETVVIEFEGKQIELKGTFEEQYQQWRKLLRELYNKETGFDPDSSMRDPGPSEPTPHSSIHMHSRGLS